jgi:hypothetical protein
MDVRENASYYIKEKSKIKVAKCGKPKKSQIRIFVILILILYSTNFSLIIFDIVTHGPIPILTVNWHVSMSGDCQINLKPRIFGDR